MKGLWNLLRRTANPSEEENGVDIPERLRWHLTACDKCQRIAWVGVPIPHAVISDEPVEQLVRVNQGRGSSKRMKVTAPLRLMMGKMKKHVCPTPKCGNDQVKVATTAEHILGLTLLHIRRA